MFEPTNVTSKGLQSILHLTDKEESNTSNYGGRVPAVWLSSTGVLRIEYPHNNTGTKTKTLSQPGPPVGKWTQITLTQESLSGNSRFRVLIDGVEKYNVENPHDGHFNNVRVYASNPWHTAQPGYIKNLSIKANLQETLLEGRDE